jgi:hypothetical protein
LSTRVARATAPAGRTRQPRTVDRAGLVADAVRRLGLELCPRCAAADLVVDVDLGRIACAAGCVGVAEAVGECARRLTGKHLAGPREALIELAATAATAEPARAGAATLITMSTVEPRAVSWLWPGRIPAGMISVLDGPPKVGKSSVVIDLVARITSGRPWPVGAGDRDPADVILVGHEDSAAHTIRPRLDAAGADAARVHLLTEVAGRLPELPTDVDEIERAIAATRSALVVFDPISAYLGEADFHRDNEVRAALAPVAAVAERTGAAILLLRHLRKAGGVDAISRGLGSVAVGALARCMLMLLQDPDDDSAKLLTWPAINVAAQPRSIRWRFDAATGGRPPGIIWDNVACDMTADQVLDRQDARQRDREPSAVDRAANFLRAELAGSRVASAELQRRAVEAGHAERTLKRARDMLGVVTVRDGRTRTWFSELPGKGASVPLTCAGGTLGTVGPLEGEQEGQEYQEGQEPPDRDGGPLPPKAVL